MQIYIALESMSIDIDMAHNRLQIINRPTIDCLAYILKALFGLIGFHLWCSGFDQIISKDKLIGEESLIFVYIFVQLRRCWFHRAVFTRDMFSGQSTGINRISAVNSSTSTANILKRIFALKSDAFILYWNFVDLKLHTKILEFSKTILDSSVNFLDLNINLDDIQVKNHYQSRTFIFS